MSDPEEHLHRDGTQHAHPHDPVSKHTHDAVDHPDHYGGGDNPFEVIKVIEAWGLGFCLGNTVKYIARAGKKSSDPLEDLEKGAWYLVHEIERMRQSGA